MLSDEDKKKRARRMSIAVSDEVYNGLRALAALNRCSLSEYVFNILNSQVQKSIPAIEKFWEVQNELSSTDDAENKNAYA